MQVRLKNLEYKKISIIKLSLPGDINDIFFLGVGSIIDNIAILSMVQYNTVCAVLGFSGAPPLNFRLLRPPVLEWIQQLLAL